MDADRDEELVALLELAGMAPSAAPKPSGDVQALRLLTADDPEKASLSQQLLSTGSLRAREAARCAFSNMLAAVRLAMAQEDATGRPWRHSASRWAGVIGRSRLTRAWAAGSVFDEVGDTEERDRPAWERELEFIDLFDFQYGSISVQKELETGIIDLGHWRGAAAARAILIARGMGDARPSRKIANEAQQRSMDYFMRWAGEHDDIRGVVRVAAERETFFGKAIQAVLDEEKGVAPAVREGVL